MSTVERYAMINKVKVLSGERLRKVAKSCAQGRECGRRVVGVDEGAGGVVEEDAAGEVEEVVSVSGENVDGDEEEGG